MKTTLTMFAIAALAALALVGLSLDSQACDGKGKNKGATVAAAQSTCPVMGGAIDKSVYTDYQGKRIYFCCEGCIETFEKAPETYLKKLEAKGETPIDIPKSAEKARVAPEGFCMVDEASAEGTVYHEVPAPCGSGS